MGFVAGAHQDGEVEGAGGGGDHHVVGRDEGAGEGKFGKDIGVVLRDGVVEGDGVEVLAKRLKARPALGGAAGRIGEAPSDHGGSERWNRRSGNAADCQRNWRRLRRARHGSERWRARSAMRSLLLTAGSPRN